MRFVAAAMAFLLTLSALAHAADTRPVQTMLGEWKDTARNDRTVPYKIYYSPQTTSPRPVVIFSHGLGGNREGSEFLLSYLAANGYVAVAVQHPGSDTPAVFGNITRETPVAAIDSAKIQGNMAQAMSPGVAVDRFRD